MKESKLHNILDLIEEISKVDEMIDLHKNSDSTLMYDQYQNQKLKLTGLLFKELLTDSDNRSEIMYLIKVFIDRFYEKEIKHHQVFDKDDNLRKIEHVLENY